MFERIDHAADAVETPIGYLPVSLDLSGLNVSQEDLQKLMRVDESDWQKEASSLEDYFVKTFGEKLPQGIREELKGLKDRLR